MRLAAADATTEKKPAIPASVASLGQVEPDQGSPPPIQDGTVGGKVLSDPNGQQRTLPAGIIEHRNSAKNGNSATTMASGSAAQQTLISRSNSGSRQPLLRLLLWFAIGALAVAVVVAIVMRRMF